MSLSEYQLRCVNGHFYTHTTPHQGPTIPVCPVCGGAYERIVAIVPARGCGC